MIPRRQPLAVFVAEALLKEFHMIYVEFSRLASPKVEYVETDTCTSLIHQPPFRLNGRVGHLIMRLRHVDFLQNTTGYKTENGRRGRKGEGEVGTPGMSGSYTIARFRVVLKRHHPCESSEARICGENSSWSSFYDRILEKRMESFYTADSIPVSFPRVSHPQLR